MNISALLRELLFSHDCVIVPGFGAFIGNYIPAQIDRSSGTFFPPMRKVSFNRNIVHNDGLLVGRLSEVLKINYGDARTIVEEYSVNFQKRLARGEKILIDHIGIFSNNSEGSLQFEPEKDANYYLGSYGLESFRMEPLAGYNIRKRMVAGKMPEPVRSSSFRRNLWRAAVVVPLLSALFYVSVKNDLFHVITQQSSLNPLVKEDSASNLNPEAKSVDSTLIPGTGAKSVVETPVSSPAPVLSYSIITGSFKSVENARQQADVLKKQGYEPEVFAAPNGFYRVSAMRCTDIPSALSKRDSIKDFFPESWIVKN
jgi:hypothetical protein